MTRFQYSTFNVVYDSALQDMVASFVPAQQTVGWGPILTEVTLQGWEIVSVVGHPVAGGGDAVLSAAGGHIRPIWMEVTGYRFFCKRPLEGRDPEAGGSD